MLVSVITPFYNSAKFISKTIESVINQTYSDWELILVNDCSTDDSVAIVNKFAEKDSRIKLIELKVNSGVAEARNEGLRSAKGRFAAFIDSDDLWDSLKLEAQVNFMCTNNYSFSHTAYRKIDSSGNVFVNKVDVSSEVNYKSLLKHNEIGCLTVMYDVNQLGKYYFPRIGHEDYATWLQILRNSNTSYGLNEVLGSYRVHTGSVSSNKIKAAKYSWGVLRHSERIPFVKALYYFSFYALNAVARRIF